jgi:hypothetical protein
MIAFDGANRKKGSNNENAIVRIDFAGDLVEYSLQTLRCGSQRHS